MANHGLNKLMGGQFFRIKPNLCPHCQHRRQMSDGWDYCEQRGKLLSDPHSEQGKCDLFEDGPVRDDAYEAELAEAARSYKAFQQERKARRTELSVW